MRDHALEGHEQAALAHLDEARHALRDLHAREPLLAGLGVDDEDGQAERERRDVREGLARADRERGEDREDLPVERDLQLLQLLLGAVVDVPDQDPLLGESGRELARPDARLARAQVDHALPDLAQGLVRRPPVGRAHGDPRCLLAQQAGDAEHEELVDHQRRDGQELHALEERDVLVFCQLEHAGADVDLGQLSVEEPFSRLGRRHLGHVTTVRPWPPDRACSRRRSGSG